MKARGVLLSILASFVLCSAQISSFGNQRLPNNQETESAQTGNAVIEGLRRALTGASGSSRSSTSLDVRRKSHNVSSFLHRRTQTSVFGSARLGHGKNDSRSSSSSSGAADPGWKEKYYGIKKGRKGIGKGKRGVSPVYGKGKKSSSGSKVGGKGKGKGSKNSSKAKGSKSSKGNKFCRNFTFHDRRRLQFKGEDCAPNILNIARRNPELSIFVDLIERAGLEQIFDCAGK